MSYATAGLKLLVSGLTGGPNVWYYTSADAHGAVDATDYFSDGLERGMKAEDVVLVVDTATPTITIHTVTAVDSDGNATIGASGA
jgi:hypothetical protein